MSICCDCGKDKQAFLCLSCNDKWLNQSERRGRVEELKRCIKIFNRDMIAEDSPGVTLEKFEKRLLALESLDRLEK